MEEDVRERLSGKQKKQFFANVLISCNRNKIKIEERRKVNNNARWTSTENIFEQKTMIFFAGAFLTFKNAKQKM